MKEYSKISLHCHFCGQNADRTIDKSHNAFLSYDLGQAFTFIDDAKKAEMDMIAMTHANVIHSAEFILIKEYARLQEITILLGVEINLRNEEDNSKYWHIVMIFSEDTNPIMVESEIDTHVNKNKGNYLVLDQLIELALNNKSIIMVHGLKQTKVSAVQNINMISEIDSIRNAIPIVVEDNKKYHKNVLKTKIKNTLDQINLEIFEGENISCSDRGKCSSIESPTYIWSENTFDDLYFSCLMNKTRVYRRDDIVEKTSYIKKIVIRESGDHLNDNEAITCSHGLNTIIGPSGSGKTLLLDLICRKLTGKNLEHRTISKKADYSALYDIDNIYVYDQDDKLVKMGNIEVVEGEDLYKRVILAHENNQEGLMKEMGLSVQTDKFIDLINGFNADMNEYKETALKLEESNDAINSSLKRVISYKNYLDRNKINSNIVINYNKNMTLRNTLTEYNSNIRVINEDIVNLDNHFNELKKYQIRYHMDDELNNDLDKICGKMKSKMYNSLKHYELESNKIELVQCIEAFIYECTHDYNKLNGERFSDYNEKKQLLNKELNEITHMAFQNVLSRKKLKVPVLSKESFEKSVTFNGSKNTKLNIKTINNIMEGANIKSFFPTNIGNHPKINRSQFKGDFDIFDEISMKSFLDIFICNKFSGHITITNEVSNYIDYDIMIKTSDDADYESIDNITAGTLSKIYIKEMFKSKLENVKTNTIILYDQPETNMEKKFIYEELSSVLSEYRKKFQIFITTHEPILVVNTDSNNIIKANNEKTVSSSNCIEYDNVSFVGTNSKAEYVNEVALLIDGGKETVKERSTIYGGLTHENRSY